MITAQKWVAVGFGGPEVLRNIEVGVPDPGPGQVRIDVRAAGLNPADAKHVAPGQDPKLLPLSIGYEVAGIVTSLGPDTELASGDGAVGDEVVASQVIGAGTAPPADSCMSASCGPPRGRNCTATSAAAATMRPAEMRKDSRYPATRDPAACAVRPFPPGWVGGVTDAVRQQGPRVRHHHRRPRETRPLRSRPPRRQAGPRGGGGMG